MSDGSRKTHCRHRDLSPELEIQNYFFFTTKYAAVSTTRYIPALLAATLDCDTHQVHAIAATMAMNPRIEPTLPRGERNPISSSCAAETVRRKRTCASSETSHAIIPPTSDALMM